MSPGRSALSAQLQQLAANRLAHTAAQQPEVPVFFGHDPIETGNKENVANCIVLVTTYKYAGSHVDTSSVKMSIQLQEIYFSALKLLTAILRLKKTATKSTHL